MLTHTQYPKKLSVMQLMTTDPEAQSPLQWLVGHERSVRLARRKTTYIFKDDNIFLKPVLIGYLDHHSILGIGRSKRKYVITDLYWILY